MSDDPTGRILAAIERLDVPIERLDAAMERLDAGQNKLRGDLMARMDRLQDALTLQHDDVTVSMGAANAPSASPAVRRRKPAPLARS